MITQEYLKSRLRYEPETGHFYWLNSKAPWRNGTRAGCYNSSGGYVMITMDGNNKYYGHRLAWLYVYGYVPSEMDHINRIRNDNRINNLRICTRSENQANRAERKRKVNLPAGVIKAKNQYQARITHNGKFIYLGLFKTPEMASYTYQIKRKELFGEFA